MYVIHLTVVLFYHSSCAPQKSRKTPGSTKGKPQKSGVVGTSEATCDVPHSIKIDPLVMYNVLTRMHTHVHTVHTYVGIYVRVYVCTNELHIHTLNVYILYIICLYCTLYVRTYHAQMYICTYVCNRSILD